MAQKKFYAVRNGREPGIYRTWDECKAQVDGYPNAAYKGFARLEEAEAYLEIRKSPAPTPLPLEPAPAAKAKPNSNRAPRRAVLSSPADEPLETPAGVKRVIIYTDGACTGNPGPGGYGAVLLHGEHRKELSGGYRLTTNNRMEIMACIVALTTLKDRCEVTLHTDSKYVVNTMTKGWARRWKLASWKKRKDWRNPEAGWEEALNADLWEQMLALCDQHKVRFVWVRGHAGIEENERCDELARNAVTDGDLAIDSVYENKWRR